MTWLTANYATIITFLFILSEALALIPAIKSNSIFGFIVNILTWLKDKLVDGSSK